MPVVTVPSLLLAFVGAQAALDPGGEPTALLTDDGVLRAVLPCLPSSAGASSSSVTTDSTPLSPAAGLAVLVTWVVVTRVVVLLGAAAWRLRTRDV